MSTVPNENLLKPEARILLHLYFSDKRLYPTFLAKELALPVRTVSRKLETLTRSGITEKINGRFYKLTPVGECTTKTFLSPDRFSSFFSFQQLFRGQQAFRPILFDLILASALVDSQATIFKWADDQHEDGYVFINEDPSAIPSATKTINIHTGEWGPLRVPSAKEASAKAAREGVKITIIGHNPVSSEQLSLNELTNCTCESEVDCRRTEELLNHPNVNVYVGRATREVYHFTVIDAEDLYLQEVHPHGDPKRTAFIKNTRKLAIYHELLFEELLTDSIRVRR